MRILKSLLVALIGVTALLYALQNIANAAAIREHGLSAGGVARPMLNWAAFAVVVLLQLAIGATALKGGCDLFAARHGDADAFKAAKSIPVWAGGLSLLLWFVLVLITGAGLFQWGSDSGEMAVAKAFALGTTSALTILFVWGTRD